MIKVLLPQILLLLSEAKKYYEKEGVVLLGIFGSYAKNSYDQFSDIDIAYMLEYDTFSKKYKDGFSKILRLEEIRKSLEKRFQKKVDLVSLHSSNKKFIEHIKKEMIYV
jgi:predicted nucleotidyltransferase